jgi:hypothetical protein
VVHPLGSGLTIKSLCLSMRVETDDDSKESKQNDLLNKNRKRLVVEIRMFKNFFVSTTNATDKFPFWETQHAEARNISYEHKY